MLNQSIDLWDDATFDFAAPTPLDDFDVDITSKKFILSPPLKRPQLVRTLSSKSLKQHDSMNELETEKPKMSSLLENLRIEIPPHGLVDRVQTPRYRDIVNARLTRRMGRTDPSTDCGSDGGFRLLTRYETEDDFEIYDEFGRLTPHAVHVPKKVLRLADIPTEATMIVHDYSDGTPRSLPRLSVRPIQICSRATASEEEDWGWDGFSSEDADDEKTDHFCRTYTPDVVMLSLRKQESAVVFEEDEEFVPLREATSALPSRCEGFRRHVRNRFDSVLSFLDETIEEQRIALSEVRRRGGS